MREFIDRVYSGKKIITYEDGTKATVTIENAEATVEGTPINRDNMMAIQNYQHEDVDFGKNSITKTNGKNEVETINFEENHIVKKFMGEKTITQTITFTENGYTRRLS